MHKILQAVCVSALVAAAAEAAIAADYSHTLVSVAKPSLQPAAKKAPGKGATKAATKTATKSATKATAKTATKAADKTGTQAKPAGVQTRATSKGSDQAATTSAKSAAASDGAAAAPVETTTAPAAEGEAAKPTGAQLLAAAYDAYKAEPTEANQKAVWSAFHAFVSQPSVVKAPAASLIKSSAVLTQVGARALDAGSGRIWTVTKLPGVHLAVIQWADSKAVVTYVGRRHRTRKVTYTTTWRSQDLALPSDVILKDARLIGNGEGTRGLILVGDEQGSSLWLKEYRPAENGWLERPNQFGSIPSFLTENVSGRVGFRGGDLIFTVARVVPGKAEGLTMSVPEADSATYKFWLHPGESGYVLQTRLPDEDQFGIVHQLVDAIAANRTDVARSLLSDPKLLSIPKYVGLRFPSPAFHVVEMASPPSGALRYRLITGMKDDLIFDVGRVKDHSIIKAIFIAPPDAFLHDIASHLPAYESTATVPATPDS